MRHNIKKLKILWLVLKILQLDRLKRILMIYKLQKIIEANLKQNYIGGIKMILIINFMIQIKLKNMCKKKKMS